MLSKFRRRVSRVSTTNRFCSFPTVAEVGRGRLKLVPDVAKLRVHFGDVAKNGGGLNLGLRLGQAVCEA